MGETSEGLSDEQNEEVTEPSEGVSDEGNSEDEGGDISNEDPSNEDPVEEEPSEGDVEDNETETPADEAGVEDGDSDGAENDLMSAQPNAVGVEAVVEPETGNFDYASSDTNVTDGFTFTVTAKEGHKITAVQYKVGDTGTATDAVKGSADNSYTIPASVFTAAEDAKIYILVATAELEKYDITYTENEGIEKLEYTEGTATKVYEDTNKPKVTEGQDFKFTLTPKKYYKITKVMAGTTELKADTKKAYTIKTVTAATTITVETALDAAQCNSVVFKLDTASDARSATATLSGNDLEITPVTAGETILVPSADVFVNITPKDGYEIKKVNGKDVTPVDGKVTQKLTFSNRKATVTVKTEAVVSVSDNTIIFDNQADHMTYKVTGDTFVKAAEGKNDTYRAAKGGMRLQFTVTATGSYLPTVTQKSGSTEKPIEASKTTKTATGATYVYIVPTSQLTTDADDTFVITETADNRNFVLSGDLSNVNIKASKDGMRFSLPAVADNVITYTTLLNDTVAFEITAKDGVTLKTVTSQVGESGKATAANVTNGTANVEIKATDNVTIKIVAEDQYVASKLKDAEGTALPVVDAAKNSYNVSYKGTYKANVTKGNAGTAVTLSEIKVFKGTAEVKGKEGQTFIDGINGTEATIDLSNADAAIQGSSLTLELYTKEGVGDEAKSVKVASYTMIVSVAAANIQINKKAAATATQAIDTTKTYTVTAAKGVDLNTLVPTVTDADSIIAKTEYDNGKLTVTMAAKKGIKGKTATITIAEKDVADSASATLTITADDLISEKTKEPTVKLVAATDVSFKLTLSAKTDTTVDEDHLYYKVDTTKSDTTKSDTISGNDSSTSKTTYVKKQNDSQNAVITVSDDELGTGSAASYNVEVSLVHSSEAIVGNTLADANKLGESKSSKQTFKTQTPAYEDKLKLKKINATVVTDQSDVVIAEPQFNKYTTYLSLADTDSVKDITPNIANGARLTVGETDDGKIKASATQNTALGKHKIQVTAFAKDGLYASVATIDVTVVRGVHNLSVKVPSTNLYKAAKKAATVKGTVVYNEGISNPAPKNKAVTWSIVDATKNSDTPITKMVTVKNGKVTVNKNFILESDPQENTFIIKVTAANGAVGYSDEITITNTPEALGKLVIATEVTSGDTGGTDVETLADEVTGYKVVVVPGADPKKAVDVEANKLLNTKAVVVKSGVAVAEDGSLGLDDVIATGNLTLKSSGGKNVTVDATGKITVNKPVKAKLTATANDGSKKSVDLTLNVINDKTGDKALALKISSEETGAAIFTPATTGDDKPKAAGETNEKSYAGNAVTRLVAEIQVMKDDNSDYEEAKSFTNTSITAAGGKVTQIVGNKAYITTDKDVVTITLTDKSQKNVKYIYKLTNTNITGTATPAVKVNGKLNQSGKQSEQNVNLNLEKVTATSTTDKVLVAKVDVDWSAMTAKNTGDLVAFNDVLLTKVYKIAPDANKKAALKLDFGSGDSNLTFNQNSYKLKVTVGEATENGSELADFKALMKPAKATVSVTKTAKLTYKPVLSYTINTKDSTGAALTGKANIKNAEMNVTYNTTLLNANIKGQENMFATYFKLSDDGKKLELNIPAGATKDQKDAMIKFLADKKNKNHLTGYLTYTANPVASYYNLSTGTGTNTVKITVTVKDAAAVQYVAVGKPEIEKKAAASTEITLKEKKSNAEATIAYAILDDSKATAKGWTAKAEAGKVVLTRATDDLVVNKSYTVPLIVLPAGSFYADRLSENADDNAALVKANGVKVSVSVKVKAYESPLDVAKGKLDAWLKGNEIKAILTNDLTEENLLKTAREASITTESGVTLAYAQKDSKNDYTLTPATEAAAGSVTGSFVLTMGDKTETITFELVIPQLEEQNP